MNDLLWPEGDAEAYIIVHNQNFDYFHAKATVMWSPTAKLATLSVAGDHLLASK